MSGKVGGGVGHCSLYFHSATPSQVWHPQAAALSIGPFEKRENSFSLFSSPFSSPSLPATALPWPSGALPSKLGLPWITDPALPVWRSTDPACGSRAPPRRARQSRRSRSALPRLFSRAGSSCWEACRWPSRASSRCSNCTRRWESRWSVPARSSALRLIRNETEGEAMLGSGWPA